MRGFVRRECAVLDGGQDEFDYEFCSGFRFSSFFGESWDFAGATSFVLVTSLGWIGSLSAGVQTTIDVVTLRAMRWYYSVCICTKPHLRYMLANT
jgi:hypothetical protein